MEWLSLCYYSPWGLQYYQKKSQVGAQTWIFGRLFLFLTDNSLFSWICFLYLSPMTNKRNIFNQYIDQSDLVPNQRGRFCHHSLVGFFTTILSYKGGAFRLSTINKNSKKYSKKNCYLVGAVRLLKKMSTRKFPAMSNLTTGADNAVRQMGGGNLFIQRNGNVELCHVSTKHTINGNLARLYELTA